MAEQQQAPDISFVIPALNEAHNIPRTLDSIRQQAGVYRYEVVVIDNGSTDDTVALAKQAGAIVMQDTMATIGALRNIGVRLATGRLLVFIDADVSLTDAWRSNLPGVLESLENGDLIVTGSHCSPPDDCSWIEQNWFREFAFEQEVSHLGTGHLMLAREFFLQIGGFDDQLETGEDYDLCVRATDAGARIINNPQLRVVHHDFPQTLNQFVRREAWHGRGDVDSFGRFIRSKVALGATVFLFAHLLVLMGVLVPGGALLAVAGLGLLVLLLLASTWMKYRHAPWRARIVNTVLFYFYYLGRLLSFLHVVQRKPARCVAAE